MIYSSEKDIKGSPWMIPSFISVSASLLGMVKPVIIVHGGAWGIPDRLVEANLSGVEKSVKAGWKVLEAGGSALDAVVAAVNVLEDDPSFDAGIGSVLTEDGTVEMDALIMDGAKLDAGAVAGLRDVRYPIRLALKVMEETPHVMMIGEGASRVAAEFGLERINRKSWLQMRRPRSSRSGPRNPCLVIHSATTRLERWHLTVKGTSAMPSQPSGWSGRPSRMEKWRQGSSIPGLNQGHG